MRTRRPHHTGHHSGSTNGSGTASALEAPCGFGAGLGFGLGVHHVLWSAQSETWHSRQQYATDQHLVHARSLATFVPAAAQRLGVR
jgi:hypothetical protein